MPSSPQAASASDSTATVRRSRRRIRGSDLPAERIGVPARDARALALLPQRDDDELAAGDVVAADVDEPAVVEVEHVERAAIAGARVPGLERPRDPRGDLAL